MVSFSDPLSLYSIPALWVLAYYPHFKKVFALKKAKQFDGVSPRTNVASVAAIKDIPSEFTNRLLRMEGAHQNGLENMFFFALAVLAGNYAGLPNETLNKASALFLLWRLTYNYVYLKNTTQSVANLRTGLWFSSLGFPFYLLFKAANAVYAKGS